MDAYKLTPQTGLTPGGTATSNTITLAGLPGPTNLSISLGGSSELDGANNGNTSRYFTATSNSSPYTLTGPEYGPAYGVWEAFNGLTDNSNVYYSDQVDGQPNRLIELTVDFGSPVLINKYRLYPGFISAAWSLTGWKIWGSNDNTNWTELDSQDNGSVMSQAYSSFYTFVGAPYRYYKFSTDNHGDSGVAMRDIYFVEDTTDPTAAYDLIINSTSTGSATAVVSNGDTVAVEVPLSAEENAVQHTILDFENYKQTVFTTVTENTNEGPQHFSVYEDKLPFEFLEAYTPSSPNNSVFIVDELTNGTSSQAITDVGSPDAGTFNDGESYIFAADYFGDKVQRINPATGQVVQTINVTKPYSVHYSPIQSPVSTDIAHTLIACPDTDTVYIYDGASHSLMNTVSVGTRPVAVYGAVTDTSGDFGFWVACFDANTVEYWEKIGAAAPVLTDTYTMPADSGPAFLIVDKQTGDCYVSLLKTNQIAKCQVSDTTVHVNDLTSDPWDMAVSDTYLYVALPQENRIAAVELANNTNITYSVASDDVSHLDIIDGELWSLSYNTGDATRYEFTNDTTLGRGITIGANSDSEATLSNTTWTLLGEGEYALIFNGTSSYAETNLTDLQSNEFEYEVKYLQDTKGSNQILVMKAFMQLYAERSGEIRFYLKDIDTDSYVTVAVAMPADGLHTLKWGFSRTSGEQYLELDGVRTSVFHTPNTIAIQTGSGSLRFGGQDATTELFDGTLHYVKYTDHSDPTKNLHYKINEGSGNTIYNSISLASSHRLGMGVAYSEDTNSVYMLNMYEDAPLRYGIPDGDPDNFDLTDATDATGGVEITSNTITISGLVGGTTMSIPSIYGAQIVVNGQDVGTEAVIVNGDEVAIKITPDGTADVISLPVVFADLFEVWEISTTTGSVIRRRSSGYMGGG